MKVANDLKQKKLCFSVKKEPAESFIQNVIENDDAVHEELVILNDMFYMFT